jgi:hypothetical protein
MLERMEGWYFPVVRGMIAFEGMRNRIMSCFRSFFDFDDKYLGIGKFVVVTY